MSRWKTLAVIVASGLTLLLAAALLVPYFVSLTSVQARIVTELSQRLGGVVKIEALRLSLLPLPHVVLTDASVAIPDSFGATFESVSVYPRLAALVRGEFQPVRASLTARDVTIRLPRANGTDGASIAASPAMTDSPAQLQAAAAGALAALSSAAAARAPGLVVVVESGSVHLFDSHARAVLFTDVALQMQLPPERLRLDLTCRSSLWDHLTLHAEMEPAHFEGDANIEMSHLRPHLLVAQFLPELGLQVEDSDASLSARVTFDESAVLQAEIDGSLPLLTLRRGDESLVINGETVNASLLIDDSTTTFSLHTLQLAQPRLQLSGEVSFDPGAPLARVQLEARDVDVAAARTVTTFFAAGAEVPREIFGVLSGGQVPRVQLQAQGPSFADLMNLNALTIDGSLVDGQVRVPQAENPKAALELTDVSGDVALADGVLRGERLIARYGKARVHDGTLRLGLVGPTPELHVEATVEADAAEVPDLLKRFVANAALTSELDRLSNVEGTATAKLALNGTTRDVAVTVDVAPLSLSARLEGMKEPLRIEGGNVAYASGGLAATDLQVTTGGSTLSHVSAHLDWSNARTSIAATVGPSRVVLAEAFSFASRWLRDVPWNPEAISGTVVADSLSIAGPADEPSDWRVDLIGAVEQLAIDSAPLRERLALRYPISLSALRFMREGTASISASGKFAAQRGLSGEVDLMSSADALHIKRLVVHDAESDASVALLLTAHEANFEFKGKVTKATLDSLVPDHHLLGGWLGGDFRARILIDDPMRSTVAGKLEASDVSGPGADDVRLAHLALTGSAGTIAIDATLVTPVTSHLDVHGSVMPSPRDFVVDLDVTGDRLDWNQLTPLLPHDGDGESAASRLPVPPLRGRVRVAADSFTYSGFTWDALRATVTLAASGPTIRISEGKLCGIATPGTIAIAASELSVAFQPAAKGQELDSTVTCLGGQKGALTGRFDLSAKISGRGTLAEVGALGRALNGHVEFTARNGRVARVGRGAQLLSALSVATGSFGEVAGLTKEDLPYASIKAIGDLAGGSLVLREAIIDGPTVQMVGQGSINVIDQTLNVTLLVAPLRKIDSVVSQIPVIRNILGDRLVSIPVAVSGSINNPVVTPLSPSAVGRELLSLMERTLSLPFQLVAPLWPGGEKK
ncbi:MAG: AsmA-like C-terminal domain-containing protein [Deltaproteobacteria bacterium]|nr:AsmA-like C-terminal domain-containing protein [Deltaproteobacteria bacterium]MBI3388127.1 AsmA-like C-terminal domain-containing protein [Deltaproteobacteria bacterium]